MRSGAWQQKAGKPAKAPRLLGPLKGLAAYIVQRAPMKNERPIGLAG
jgi:hypothetical protein